MAKKKIIHVIGRLDYGGAERLLLDISRKIDKTEFELSIVTLKGHGQLESKFVEAGVPVRVIEKRFKGDIFVIKKLK